MHTELAENFLTQYKKQTESLLSNFFKEKKKEAKNIGTLPLQTLKKIYSLTQGGKKIRGALMLLGYQLAGGKKIKEISDASLSIELFHTALLIHDDIMDQDELRRGLPTIHKQFELQAKSKTGTPKAERYGESMAISAGDLAIFLSLSKLLESNFPETALFKAAKLLTDHALRVIYGQILDISMPLKKHNTQEDIINLLFLKTADYTGTLPLEMGTTLAEFTEPKTIKALREYGCCLGWAFQIRDDLLGVFGHKNKLGKSIGSDLRERKQTLLLLHLANKGNGTQKKLLKQLLGKKQFKNKDITKLKQLLLNSGSYQYVFNLGMNYVANGKRMIPKITKEKNLAALLESFIDFAMERQS